MPAPIALTMGEPGGVAPEITVKAWRRLRDEAVPFFVLADPALFADAPVAPISAPAEARDHFGDALPVLPLNAATQSSPGEARAANAGAILESIERAVAFTREGAARAVVTNPIQKSSLREAGFAFPGHTEYLEALTRESAAPNEEPGDAPHRAVMMIAGPGLRTVPVTIHLSVRDALAALTPDLILRTGLVVHRALQRDFAIAAPRLAVSGLNPHAGEAGAMGFEDEMVIAPAIEELRERGVDANGPLPADTMFHEHARARYDAALCMLHDQALIPAKTLFFDDAVNVTLGLPIVRTSPDHGTALDIAGANVARPDSLIAAIRLADDLVARRERARA